MRCAGLRSFAIERQLGCLNYQKPVQGECLRGNSVPFTECHFKLETLSPQRLLDLQGLVGSLTYINRMQRVLHSDWVCIRRSVTLGRVRHDRSLGKFSDQILPRGVERIVVSTFL